MEDTKLNTLTGKIIGSAIQVHQYLGPGLLESAYELCLCHEFNLVNIKFERQKPIPLKYKNIFIKFAYKADIIVENSIIVEIKTVKSIEPIHEAQLLTYLKLLQLPIGLILNFNVRYLKDGIKRMVFN